MKINCRLELSFELTRSTHHLFFSLIFQLTMPHSSSSLLFIENICISFCLRSFIKLLIESFYFLSQKQSIFLFCKFISPSVDQRQWWWVFIEFSAQSSLRDYLTHSAYVSFCPSSHSLTRRISSLDK